MGASSSVLEYSSVENQTQCRQTPGDGKDNKEKEVAVENEVGDSSVEDEDKTGLEASPPSMESKTPDDNEKDIEKKINGDEEEGQGEEEEEGECPLCLFLKTGACRDNFITFDNCIDAATKDNEDPTLKCFDLFTIWKKCVDEHSDYYEPFKRLEKEYSEHKEAKGLETNAASIDSEHKAEAAAKEVESNTASNGSDQNVAL